MHRRGYKKPHLQREKAYKPPIVELHNTHKHTEHACASLLLTLSNRASACSLSAGFRVLLRAWTSACVSIVPPPNQNAGTEDLFTQTKRQCIIRGSEVDLSHQSVSVISSLTHNTCAWVNQSSKDKIIYYMRARFVCFFLDAHAQSIFSCEWAYINSIHRVLFP